MTKITAQSQIANALLGDPLMAALGVSTADLAVDTRIYWGRYLSTPKTTGGTQQAAIANRAFIGAIYVPRLITFDQIIQPIGTVNGNVLLGIYNDNTDTPVGGSLAVSTGSTPVAAPTVGTINKQLTKGLYWIVIMFDAGVATYTRAHTNTMLGAPFDGNRYDAGSFALTDPCPAITNDAGVSPYTSLRIKSVDA